MITLKLISSDDEVYGYEIKGHAGYADRGEDIVCSAISALAISTANGLVEHVKVRVDCMTQEGYLKCKVIEYDSLDPLKKTMTKVLIDTMISGIRDIAKQYVGFVEIVK